MADVADDRGDVQEENAGARLLHPPSVMYCWQVVLTLAFLGDTVATERPESH